MNFRPSDLSSGTAKGVRLIDSVELAELDVKFKGSDARSSSFCFSLEEIGRLDEKSDRVVEGELEFEAFFNGFDVIGFEAGLDKEGLLDVWALDLPGLIISIFFLASDEFGRFEASIII